MTRTINRLKLIFLGVFAVLSVGVLVWQVGWVMPMKKCEEAHKWWDHGQRVCAQPVLISDITGRTIQDKEAEAAARAAIGRPPAPVQNP
ncbi:hypothetical protein [Phenylobacterium sp.]|uniref:hypothetical protein n=1 Tax=Phenylobacterium sp. TaxID=1871053 RepID=UPI002FDFA59F